MPLINENIQNARQAIVEVLEESHADLLEEINTAIAALPEEATVQIVDPYETTIAVNAHLLISSSVRARMIMKISILTNSKA